LHIEDAGTSRESTIISSHTVVGEKTVERGGARRRGPGNFKRKPKKTRGKSEVELEVSKDEREFNRNAKKKRLGEDAGTPWRGDLPKSACREQEAARRASR